MASAGGEGRGVSGGQKGTTAEESAEETPLKVRCRTCCRCWLPSLLLLAWQLKHSFFSDITLQFVMSLCHCWLLLRSEVVPGMIRGAKQSVCDRNCHLCFQRCPEYCSLTTQPKTKTKNVTLRKYFWDWVVLFYNNTMWQERSLSRYICKMLCILHSNLTETVIYEGAEKAKSS